jgi:hypothetical protein
VRFRLVQVATSLAGASGFCGVMLPAHKKAPRKALVPGGQRTWQLFRERLDAMTLACGRTPADREGGEAMTVRRGVYRSGGTASVPMPTAAGPIALAIHYSERPFHVVWCSPVCSQPRWLGYLSFQTSSSGDVFESTTATCLIRETHVSCSSWVARIRHLPPHGQG